MQDPCQRVTRQVQHLECQAGEEIDVVGVDAPGTCKQSRQLEEIKSTPKQKLHIIRKDYNGIA